MKVLFVSAGGPGGEPRAVVRAQSNSLAAAGVDIHYFIVKGGGIHFYLRAVKPLKMAIASLKPDIVHAHYSLSGIVASMAGAKPLVVSLMGSDVNGGLIQRIVSYLFARLRWDATIVKSEEMKNRLGITGARVIPNGVDTSLFFERDSEVSFLVTGLQPGRKSVIFPGDPSRHEKNWRLAEEAVAILNDPLVDLVPLYGRPVEELPYWYSAAYVMLSVSLWEGSPNMVKEAMACNLPVVATPAGDIPWLLDGLKSSLVVDWSPEKVASALRRILGEKKRSDGRKRIDELNLSSVKVAEHITEIYNALSG